MPEARSYRAWLDRMSYHPEWVLGAATFTIFVEGSVKDRTELTTPSEKKRPKEIEALINIHPLVRYHGLHPSRMDLIRAHQLVEAGHRHDAYHMVVNYTPPAMRQSVLTSLRKSLTFWLAYRDAVAKACRLTQPS